jgi:hypothetical protein
LEEAWFGKHGSNPCKQELPSAILVRGDVAKGVKQIKVGTTLHFGRKGREFLIRVGSRLRARARSRRNT